jgi:redox-sensitive bicupin YhaK (pirin superfamily)
MTARRTSVTADHTPPGDRVAVASHHLTDLARSATSHILGDVAVADDLARRDELHRRQHQLDVLLRPEATARRPVDAGVGPWTTTHSRSVGGDTDGVTAPQVEVHRAASRFRTRTPGGLSLHSFSFGSHYDAQNVCHGPLMVNNDERVAAGSGFDDHPHADAEILTWVVSGSLLHTDSGGHSGVVYRGLAQRMTAGSGIVHSERNDAYRLDPTRPAAPVRFVQMWLRPDEPGVAPSYEQREVHLVDLRTAWVPIASGSLPDAAVSLGSAGSTLWVAVVTAGQSRTLPAGPLAHVYVTTGAVELEGVGRLTEGDSLRITGEAGLRLTGVSGVAELLAWTMAR